MLTDNFWYRKVDILVTSDLLARGMGMTIFFYAIQYDLPSEDEEESLTMFTVSAILQMWDS